VVTAKFASNSLEYNDVVFFIKDTHDVILNCNDKTFTTNYSSNPAYVVYAYNSTDIVVENMNTNWSNNAICFENVNDSSIENSEIISKAPIEVYESYGLTILENTITVVTENDAYGIYSDDCIINSTIEDNVFDLTADAYAYAIYAYYNISNSEISGNAITADAEYTTFGIVAYDEYIVNSTITNNVFDLYSDTDDVYGIYADESILNTVISGNTLTGDAENYAYAICAYYEDINDSRITNNVIDLTTEEYGNDVYGIYADGGINNAVISGNTFTGWAYYYAYGICAYGEDINDSTITNNVFDLYSDDEYTYNIYADDMVNNTVISGNTFTGWAYYYAYGIYAYDGIINSVIEDNVFDIYAYEDYAYGIYSYYLIDSTTISENTFDLESYYDDVYGIYAEYDDIVNTTISGNTFNETAYYYAYGIYAYDYNIINSTITDNVFDIYAYDEYVYGIYVCDNVENTVISGNTFDLESFYYDVYGIYVDEYTTNTTISENTFNLLSQDDYAYGIYLYDDVEDCLISGNTITANAEYDAYGIYISDGYMINTTVVDNIIDAYSRYDDYAYGIYVEDGIENCLISGNTITADADYDAYGIYVDYYDIINTTITDNVIDLYSEEDYGYGIYTDNNDIIDCLISGNTITIESYYYAYGIYAYDEMINTTVEDNVLDLYSYDDYVYGIVSEYDMIDCLISGNTVTAESRWYDVYGIGSEYGYMTNTTIENNVIDVYSYDDYVYGIFSDYDMEDCLISGNNITVGSGYYEVYGICVDESDIINTTIIGNIITVYNDDDDYAYGIYAYDDILDCLISGNTIITDAYWEAYGITSYNGYMTNTTVEDNVIDVYSYDDYAYGIYAYGGEYATYSGNTITATSGSEEAYALCLDYMSNSTITGNTFTSEDYAVYLYGCEDNRFYLNNFDGLVNNGTDNYFVSSENITYTYLGNTYSSILGNYWVGYNETDVDGDGIIDTPYTVDGINDTKPLADRWNDGEIGNYIAPVAPVTPTRSSGGGGSTYDSDLADDIESKAIKAFVSSASVLYGNEIDEGYATQLRERVTTADGFTIYGNTIIVGGPEANPFAKEYNDQFEIPISNDNPGENRGVIQILKVQADSGSVVHSYVVVYIAGSDRLGTLAALEYFKTLDNLPDGPITVEWTEKGPVLVE